MSETAGIVSPACIEVYDSGRVDQSPVDPTHAWRDEAVNESQGRPWLEEGEIWESESESESYIVVPPPSPPMFPNQVYIDAPWLADLQLDEVYETTLLEPRPEIPTRPVIYDDAIEETVGPGKRSEDCPICQSDISQDAPTLIHEVCANVFCRDCLNEWIQTPLAEGTNSITCPMCRDRIGWRMQDNEIYARVTGRFRRWQFARAISARAILIEHVSRMLQRSNGDIAGVDPFHLSRIARLEERIRYMLPYYSAEEFRNIEIGAFWGLTLGDFDDSLTYEPEDFGEGARPTLTFLPQCVNHLTDETNGRFLFSSDLDEATPGPQPTLKLGPQLDSLSPESWARVESIFREFEETMNQIRDLFSRSRRDLMAINPDVFHFIFVLHANLEGILGMTFPNFLTLARHLQGERFMEAEWIDEENAYMYPSVILAED